MSFRPKPWYFEIDCPVCTSSASSFCRNPLYFFAHAMWVKWWYHANFQPFLTSFVIFHAFTAFLSYKTRKLKSISNELGKGWKLAWYHNFTHIACAKNLIGLRKKLDALCVQTGQSLSKYQGFGRKLICYIGISFF